MSHDFSFTDLGQEIPTNAEVPQHLDFLPDGREVLVFGDPAGDAQFNHQQGDNAYGYQGDCGLVSCQDVLNQFGVDVNENDVVGFAVENGLCDSTGDASSNGGTALEQQAEILRDYNVPAHAETGRNMQDLASDIEQNKGVIIEVNAGVLWNDSQYFDNGASNHAVVVTGVARDPTTGEIQGFYINDSGNDASGSGSGRFVDVQTMQQAWEETGGQCVVTDAAHGAAPGSSC
jgi:uncharacterized membrane protein